MVASEVVNQGRPDRGVESVADIDLRDIASHIRGECWWVLACDVLWKITRGVASHIRWENGVDSSIVEVYVKCTSDLISPRRAAKVELEGVVDGGVEVIDECLVEEVCVVVALEVSVQHCIVLIPFEIVRQGVID